MSDNIYEGWDKIQYEENPLRRLEMIKSIFGEALNASSASTLLPIWKEQQKEKDVLEKIINSLPPKKERTK